MAITVDQVIEAYIKTRDKLEELKKAYEASIAELKKVQENRERWLLGTMDQMGTTSMKGSAGTAFVDYKDSATVSDRNEFMAWVHEDWDTRSSFLENRVSKTAVKQLMEDGATPPPGVSYTKVKDVKVRRA